MFDKKKMHRFTHLLSILLLGLACLTCSPKKADLNVAVASNMYTAMSEIIMAFEQQYGMHIDLSSGSSGTLTAQIIQGAPFDLFVSANMDYPNALQEKNFCAENPKVCARGALVMWCNKANINSEGLSVLLDNEIKKIALANPETAPYGSAALQALKQAGIYEKVKDKLVYGESIAQVNQYISAKSIDAGFTSNAVHQSHQPNGSTSFVQVANNLYSPIEHGIVILKHGQQNNPENAALFYKFMFSDKTKSILTKFGYDLTGI